MGLDLRIPLGLMFLTIGTLMLGYGFFTWGSPLYERSMGANINVIWGAAMVLFGAVMFLLARRARANIKATPGVAGSVPHRHSH